jgi:ribulose-phosphate 3-epimerase
MESRLSADGPIVLPALLLCDFGHLADEVKRLEAAGAKAMHLDVMDGLFVPQLTYGLVVVEAVRRATAVPLEVHMMVEKPDDTAIQYAKAGADIVTLHIEGLTRAEETLAGIKAQGSQAHLAISPGTPVSYVEPFLNSCSGVLVMSVEPGFGGQAFQPSAIEKIQKLQEIRASTGYDFCIGVDGGISTKTIASVAHAGADLIVAGSAILRQGDYAKALRELEALARKSK